MNQYEKFIEHSRKQLLCHLRPGLMHPVTPAAALDFVDQVLEDWRRQFGNQELAPPTLIERGFWYVLYLYEDVNLALELGAGRDPWIVRQQSSLQGLYDMLKNRSALAPGMWATRPCGDVWESWDDVEAADWHIVGQVRG